MLSKGAKRTIFYDITIILQYCLDKTIARSGDIYRDDSGIFSLVIKYFGITNTSVQNFAIWISSLKTIPKCLRKLKVFFSKFNIENISESMWTRLKSIFLHLYLTWGIVLCVILICSILSSSSSRNASSCLQRQAMVPQSPVSRASRVITCCIQIKIRRDSGDSIFLLYK